MYKIFVCTKFYVQNNICVYKKYFTWYFKNLLLLCLDSSKNLWFDAFIKMMFWGATEPSKESILVSIIIFLILQDTSIRNFLVTSTTVTGVSGVRASTDDDEKSW